MAALTISVLVTNSTANDEKQQLLLIPANPDAGFEYPYYLKIPGTISTKKKLFLIVEPNNSGVHDDFDQHLKNTKSDVLGHGFGGPVASDLKLPLLKPVFPRSKSQKNIYTHALDSDSMHVNNGPSQRLDLQLLSMVEDARKQLESQDIRVEEKFVILGFSASGTFSNRFAFLHPTSLFAVVSGAVNAIPMLPLSELDNNALNYPIGTSDLNAFTGGGFDMKSWLELPQLIFMGATDDNDAVKFDDAFSKIERELIHKLLGKDMASRWSKAQSILLESNANTTLVSYGQIGHWTNGRIRRDVVNFVDSAIQKNIYESVKESGKGL